MKKIIFVLLLLGGICFADEFKTGSYCAFSLDGSDHSAASITYIGPLFHDSDYYIVEHNNYKYIIRKGDILYTRFLEDAKPISRWVYYRIKVEDIRPNVITYSKERLDD